jgi:hypothetical protein
LRGNQQSQKERKRRHRKNGREPDSFSHFDASNWETFQCPKTVLLGRGGDSPALT